MGQERDEDDGGESIVENRTDEDEIHQGIDFLRVFFWRWHVRRGWRWKREKSGGGGGGYINGDRDRDRESFGVIEFKGGGKKKSVL